MKQEKTIEQKIRDAISYIGVTKLQEGKMWAGKILEAMGSELPAQYADKAEFFALSDINVVE